MNRRYFTLATLCAGLIVGCGGNTSLTYQSPSQYYRGTFTLKKVKYYAPGSATMVANVTPGVGFKAYTWGTNFAASITRWNKSREGYIAFSDMYEFGAFEEKDTPNGTEFSFIQNSTVIATGTMRRAQVPSLGTSVSIPPKGLFGGEQLSFGNGGVTGIGTINGAVLPTGEFSATTSTSDSVYTFTGTFQADGTILHAVIYANGTALSPFQAPTYSYDGKTIIIKWAYVDQPLDGYWLTMTPA